MKPLISVVMAVYNGEKYIKEQIDSILEQTYRNIELIIVDDASTDDSLYIADNMAGSDKRVKVFKNPKNLGVAWNFLKALQFACGELVCFSDQDDVWRMDKLDILASLIHDDHQNMLAYSDLAICDENLQVIHPSFWKSAGIKPRKGYIHERAFLRNIAPGCSMMFRKPVADALVGLSGPGPFMHDHLTLVVSAAMGKIVYTKTALVKYRQHDRNQIGAFCDSTVNTESIICGLTEKVSWMHSVPFLLPNFNLQRLLSFCKCLCCNRLLERVSFLDYYLFLRNDCLWAKTLGILECLSPVVYKRLKKLGKNADFSLCLSRLAIIGWSLIILWHFFYKFILVKFHNFLLWLK